MRWSELKAALTERTPGRYGLISLYLWLLLGGFQVVVAPHSPPGPRLHHLSVMGLVLPEAVLSDDRLFLALQIAYFPLAALWAMRVRIPWTSWAATVVHTMAISMSQESMDYAEKSYHVVGLMLIIHAAWYQFARVELRQPAKSRELFRSPVYPRWVFYLSLLALCMTYTDAGWTKLVLNGPGWANGLSLQVWVAVDAGWDSWLARILNAHRGLAQVGQIGVLLAESLSFTCLFSRPARRIIGVVLLGFHLAIELLFGFQFYGNIVGVLLLLIIGPPEAVLLRSRERPTPAVPPG
jgi:hypothetical protein